MSPEEKAKANGDSQAFPGNGMDGMNLREIFAGLALQGILANVAALRAQPVLTHRERAEAAVQAADALLLELAKPQ